MSQRHEVDKKHGFSLPYNGIIQTFDGSPLKGMGSRAQQRTLAALSDPEPLSVNFLVVVRVPLTKPFAFWRERFDAHRSVRREAGIEDVFAYPVIGEQAVLYAVKTRTPRAVHEMIYDEAARAEIEASGFVIGGEVITLCELVD
jgi:hypothetical protein